MSAAMSLSVTSATMMDEEDFFEEEDFDFDFE